MTLETWALGSQVVPRCVSVFLYMVLFQISLPALALERNRNKGLVAFQDFPTNASQFLLPTWKYSLPGIDGQVCDMHSFVLRTADKAPNLFDPSHQLTCTSMYFCGRSDVLGDPHAHCYFSFLANGHSFTNNGQCLCSATKHEAVPWDM